MSEAPFETLGPAKLTRTMTDRLACEAVGYGWEIVRRREMPRVETVNGRPRYVHRWAVFVRIKPGTVIEVHSLNQWQWLVTNRA